MEVQLPRLANIDAYIAPVVRGNRCTLESWKMARSRILFTLSSFKDFADKIRALRLRRGLGAIVDIASLGNDFIAWSWDLRSTANIVNAANQVRTVRERDLQHSLRARA